MQWIKMLAMAVFTALLVCLTGCGGASGDEAAGETVMVSEGLFMPCTNGSYLMITDNGYCSAVELCSDDTFFEGLSAGDVIRVSHDSVRETFPGSTVVYELEKVSDGGIEDIPGDILEQLREMGWKPVTVIPDSENFDMDKICAAVMISYPGSDEPMRDHVLCFMTDGGVWEALSADEDGNASGFTEKLYSCDEAALSLMTEPCFLGSITQAEAELLAECIAAIDPDCEYYDRGDDAYPAVEDDSYFTVYFYGNDEKGEKYTVIMGVYGNNSGASYRCTDVNAVQAMKVISRCSFLADRLTGCET